jgi:hypothetical protein
MRLRFVYLFFVLNICSKAQTGDPKATATLYFADHKSKNKMNALILKSFATLEDAKKIFIKTEDAVQFMKLMEGTEKKMKEQQIGADTDYPTVEINTFTIKDIQEDKAHFNLGLLEIINKFKPNVRFFTVKLTTGNEFEPGFSYIYWMHINNKWVFISKPNLAFRK